MSWTYEDFQKLPNDGNRYELIGGELLINGFADTKPQRVFRRLFVALDEYTSNTESGYVSVVPADSLIPSTTEDEPGFLFVYLRVGDPPDIAVEILAGARGKATPTDRKVNEHWIVDPNEECIRVHRSFESVELNGDDVLTTPLFPGLSIELRRVFATP